MTKTITLIVVLLFTFGLAAIACDGNSQPTPTIDVTVQARVQEELDRLSPTPTPPPLLASTPSIISPTPTSTPTENNGSCLLTGGEIVQGGWSGKDTGSNSCNQCRCMQGVLECTEIECHPTLEPIPTPTATFTLAPVPTSTPVPMATPTPAQIDPTPTTPARPTLTLISTVTIPDGHIWSGPVWDGQHIVVTYARQQALWARRYERDLNPVSDAVRITLDADPAVTDHKHIFLNGIHFVVYSTPGDSELYLLKLDSDLNRLGFVPVVKDTTRERTKRYAAGYRWSTSACGSLLSLQGGWYRPCFHRL